MIDVVIPSHEKDKETLDLCIQGVKENIQDVRRIIVVSKNKMTDNAEWISEETFPFTIKDVGDTIGFHRKTFNYFGGLIQTTSALVLPDLCDNVLVLDSDTIFLTPKKFVDDENRVSFDVSYDVAAGVVDHPYYEHMEKLIPGLTKQTRYSGIVHHMLIQKDILQDMFNRVEEYHNKPFWKANLDVTLEDYRTWPNKGSHADAPLLLTTYELYFNYALKYFPDRVKIEPRKSILAYKGRMGVDGENIERVGSRTNLNGNVKVLPEHEENQFKFESFKDSCEHISKRCKELGYDTVTFQNHTRIGSSNHKTRCEVEIHEILQS